MVVFLAMGGGGGGGGGVLARDLPALLPKLLLLLHGQHFLKFYFLKFCVLKAAVVQLENVIWYVLNMADKDKATETSHQTAFWGKCDKLL